MKTFEFRSHTRTLVGRGASLQLGALLSSQWAVQRILIVTDGALARLGLPDTLAASLTEAGFRVACFQDVEADPPQAIVLSAIEQARHFDAQCIIGLGGGSSMDVAKLVAAMACRTTSLDDAYGIERLTGERLPLVQIPTTAGTGSEATPISIVTREDGSKAGIVSALLYADIAVLDAELTRGLPAAVTAATGIDAMVHAVEAYTSKIRKNPLSDLYAKEALRLLYNAIDPACRQGDDMQAREDMLLGAMLAGQAFANAPVGAIHALAYPLGSVFHLPHGLTNALMMGPVLRFNLPVVSSLYAELASHLCPDLQGSTESRADRLVTLLTELATGIGLPNRLSLVGVTAADLPELAELALQQQRLLVNNPRDVSLQDALRLYKEAL